MTKSYINQVKQPPYPFITVVRLKQNMMWGLNLWADKVKKKKNTKKINWSSLSVTT